MSDLVTVPGGDGSTIAEVFDNQFNHALAQQISEALNAASKAGSLHITTADSPSEVLPPTAAGTNQLIITGGGDYTIPASLTPGASDYVVVLDTKANVTIHGSPNLSVWGGLSVTTISDPTVVTIAEEAGNATATLTTADPGAIVAGNNFNDTISSAGANDTIQAGTGSNVLSASGSSALIVSGSGSDTIMVSGANDTVDARTDGSTVTLSGSAGVFLGGAAGFSLLDTGSSDTVFAGTGAGFVTASGAAGVVFGSSGPLVLVTSVAGSGAETLFGGSGNTSVYGGGADGTYILGNGALDVFQNTGGSGRVFAGAGTTSVFGTPGAPFGADQVFGGSGDLTVATNGSNDTVYAGSGGTTAYGSFGNPIGNSVIIGGSGALEAITGSSNDTIFAGSGSNTLLLGDGNNLVVGGSSDVHAQFVDFGGSATIFGGAGNTTVFGNSGSNINFLGSHGDVTMIAYGQTGAANGETLNAGFSSTNNWLNPYSGSDSVVGGSGNDAIIAGVTGDGTTTMTGGGGNNLFYFQNGNVNGSDIITDLTASSGNLVALFNYDSLYGGGAGAASKAALAGATFTAGNTSITLGDGTKVTFLDTTVAQLSQHMFSGET
ncbi:MAG TPA: calcium-binding protein [Acetobacteraceae bacterium]|nr:calcium-binding protein [Acetobacteraceae bacterium]